jgi:hypothetical protein
LKFFFPCFRDVEVLFLFRFRGSEACLAIDRIRVLTDVEGFCIRAAVWCKGTGLNDSDLKFCLSDESIGPYGGLRITVV